MVRQLQKASEVKKEVEQKEKRRTPLSRERILQRAITLADKKGIDALSMRSLAKALSVEAMSLYNHVKNKDALLDGMVELVVADIAVPEKKGSWKAQMRERALSAHSRLTEHPWAAMLLMSRINIGPFMLNYVDATLACLLHGGFTYAQADHAWNTLDSYVYGYTLQSLNFPFAPDEYKDAAEEFMPQLPMEQYPHLAGLSLEVMEGRHDGLHDLTFGLDLILDGLERVLSKEP